MSFDCILGHIGASGRYQMFVLLLMAIVEMYPGYETLMPVLVAYKQEYSCRPGNYSLGGNGTIVYDKCSVYRNETPKLSVPCSEWDFDESVMRTTIRSKYNLVCDREYLASLSTTFFFLGFLIGSTLYGIISDRFGRLFGIMSSTAHLFIFSIAAAYAENYWTFAAMRFIGGIGNGGVLSTQFTMTSEVTDPAHRPIFSLMVHTGFSMGGLYLSMFGFLLRDYFWIQIALALSMLPTIFLPLLIHESPRWLFTTGRFERAERAIRAIAKANGKTLPEDFDLKQFQTSSSLLAEKEPDPEKTHTSLWADFSSLFKTLPLAVTTLIIWYDWLVICMGYYATYFTVGDMGGNVFINFCISCVIEFPARTLAVFTSRWWGRTQTLVTTYALGGLTCLINAVIISFGPYAVALQVFSVIGRFFLTAGFDMIWFYSGEVFPTVIRNVVVGIGSTWARIGGTLAPQAALLFTVWKPAPLIILGVLPIVGALLTLILPETKDKELPETLEDGTVFVKYSWRFKPSETKVMNESKVTA